MTTAEAPQEAAQSSMGDAPPLLSVQGLSVSFRTRLGRVDALRNASFTLRQGEILGIVGESGSGKSVTCRAILGLLPDTADVSGRVEFAGADLLRMSTNELRAVRGRQISMIFQNPASHLDPLMTIGRHVAEPLRFHLGYERRAASAEAISLLAAVQIIDPALRIAALPHELSGGMKQRAMIAAAIACRPRVLLADEPTTALDVTVQARILELLRELNAARGLSIILISHDLGVIAALCDRVLVMKNGLVVEHGTTRDIIMAPRRTYTKLLIDSQPEVQARRRRGEKSADPSRATTGPTGTGPALLTVDRLSVEFALTRGIASLIQRGGRPRRIRAVDSVSFSVGRGQIFGIVGESGSGKSTVARAIARLLPPTSGRVFFRGRPIDALTGPALLGFRRSVQMIFQSPVDSLNPRLTAGQTIAEPLIMHRIVERDQVEDRVRELMELVELPRSLIGRYPRQLSGGQGQRVGIARALAMNPELLIADEITSALDVTTQAQILSLLARLRDQAGLTIVYISHDLAVVRALCQRVAVFQRGRIVEIGAVDTVLSAPREEYTRTLIASIPRIGFSPEAPLAPSPLLGEAGDAIG